MSQHGSSMVSSSIPNSEVKYQKALKQISKLINTNKILKNECEERQQILSAQLSDIALRCEQLSRKYEESEMQKRRMQQFMQELQDTNQDLRKQYQTLERQVGYLNDVLTQQNAQLKKLSVFKDQKGISELFRSYQQREAGYKRQISRLEEHIVQLKTTVDRIQQDFIQESEMRQRYEDQYNIIGLEINKYRELNNYLMDKNQHVLSDERNRNERGFSNQHEMESLVVELKRQLEMLRNVSYEREDTGEKHYVKNYEMLLEEKNNVVIQLAKTRDQLQISQSKIKEMYELQEKMSTALARSDVLIQENNMLKNRITILESKEIIDGAGFDQDSDLKVFEDKINFMMAKTDPLDTIKNGDDNTHFLTMKSFITDLQVKLQTVIDQKVSVEKKYKNLKMKFSKKAEQNIILEENHKLLKGKLQGYERLTEKLNYELERSIQAHEDEIVKMVAITNNLVGKKVEQSKTASAFIKSQFDIELQKAEKAQKTLTQEVETLKLQTGTLRIKLSDLELKYNQASELLLIHQTKLSDTANRCKELEQQNTILNEKVIKYEQLYQEEKARHETILVQKQSVSSKLNLLSEELNQKSYVWEETVRQKDANYEAEIRRNQQQGQRIREQLTTLKQQNQRLNSQLDQYRSKENSIVVSIKQDNFYLKELQLKYAEAKQLNSTLEGEIISMRNKLSNYDELQRHSQKIQTESMRKNDELNDQKRASISLKKQVQTLQMANNDLREHNQQLNSQINALKQKIYHSSNQQTPTSKELESRKTIQRLHEQVAVLQSALRDEKRAASRFGTQIQSLREQIERLEEVINKNKLREQSLLEKISSSNNDLLAVQDELFEFKTKYSQSVNKSGILSSQVERVTEKVNELTEELHSTQSRLAKAQSKYENILRDLTGTKFYIQQADKMVKRLSSVDRLEWEQQRQKQNIAALIDALNRIIRNSENIQLSNSGSNPEYNFVPASSFGNLQTNYVTHDSSENYQKINFGGSFGNDTKANIVTNDSFKGYQVSSNVQSSTNVNFSNESFGRSPHAPHSSFSPYRNYEES